MNRYQVLWIDDNAENQDGFLDSAYLNGLDINYFKTSKEGMEELFSEIEHYDAIILDAMVYNESEDEKAGLIGLLNSIKIINSLTNRKKIPYFIYSGYLDKDEHSSAREMLSDETIFIKSLDNQALFKAIKEAANNQEITQLKHKYPNIFDLCKDEYLGSKQFERIHQLIKDIENPENISNQQDALSPMRKILEAIFKKLNNLGLIPDEVQNGKGAINGASFFLAGANKGYKYNEELIHPVIGESIRHLLNLTQDASHNEGNKLGADTYLSHTSNTFLYQSLCHSMIEVLDYIKPYIDANLDRDSNLTKWEVSEISTCFSEVWIPGIITSIGDNGYGAFLPKDGGATLGIVPKKIKDHSLVQGQHIEVSTEPSPCGKKTYIKEIK